MPLKRWTLTNVETGEHLPELRLGPEDVGGKARGYAVEKRTLRGGLQQGVDVVEIFNGAMQFAVLPTRGMGLWKVRQQPAPGSVLVAPRAPGLELGWKSPVRGPVHPAFVPLFAPDGLGWLNGFDEFLVRCGLESNGAPEFDATTGRLKHPLHGKIANQPAQRVELEIDGDSGEIALRGTVDEARLYHNKLRMVSTYRTRPGSLRIDLTDEVSNPSAETGEMELLYHVNFGLPLLDPGSRVVLPAEEIVPRNARAAEGLKNWDSYGNEQPGFSEQVLFFKLRGGPDGRTQALLKNAHSTAGASLYFRLDQLPVFTIWKSTQAAADGYVTGLEPALNFPNPRSYEKQQGRVAVLKPGETRRFELSIELHPDARSVAAAEAAVQKLQGGKPPVIHAGPQPGWCAD